VLSRDRDVDSVGACVGMKGMRVQSIIRELRGEKIDIIEFSDDPVVFATHALSPAKITRVSIIDPVDKHMEVIVDDTQLSLAIGKKGQNVRLAAKLLGWKIDIKSEEEKRQEVESAMAALVPAGAPVSVLIDLGLAEKIVEKLIESNVGTVEKLGSMTPEELEAIPGIGPQVVEKILVAVNAYYAPFEPSTEAEGAEAAGAEAPAGELAEGGEGSVDAAPASLDEPLLEAESGTAPEESEKAETDPSPNGNSPDEKKEFDTIENSEGVS
jgi:transcription termination/antitermination protein NusA